MRLKSIKLAGFKSFVDPTTVPFPTNMTSVVGPNGCGKSNIIDAVRWVMGESSAKYLRGESMTDVIFNGSSARKPVGQATIELVFDNSDGTAPGEFVKFNEISVKRRVSREGQSEYFLNGAKCRRRDITDLFLGTGLGPRSYAIIEQGMISRLIEAKPEELRIYIEEAAGISKYKERRRETESRIKRTQENLERLTDLREELGRQLQHLERQAAAAEKYKTYKHEERQKKAELTVLRWQALDNDLQSWRSKTRDTELELEKLLTERVNLETSMESLRENHHERTEHFNRAQARYYEAGADIARIEQSLEHQRERSRQTAAELDQAMVNQRELRRELEQDEERLTSIQDELDMIEPEQEALAMRSEESGEQLQLAEDAMSDWQQRWEAFSARSADARRQAELAQSRIRSLEDAISQLQSRRSKLLDEQQSLDGQLDRAELDALLEQQQTLELQREEAAERIESLQDDVYECRQQLRTVEQDVSEHRQKVQSLRASLESQQALLNEQMGGQDDALQAWLGDTGLSDAPRVASALRIEDGWEFAIEQVIGRFSQGLSLPGFDHLTEALQRAPKGLALVSGQSAASAVSNGLAAKVSGVEAVGHLLDGIDTVDSVDAALAQRGGLAEGQSLITQDGVWVARDWILMPDSDAAQVGVIERQKIVNELEARLAGAEEQLESATAILEQLQEKAERAEASRDDAQGRLNEAERELGMLASRVSGLKARAEQIDERLSRIRDDIEDVVASLEEQQENLGEAREEWNLALASTEDSDVEKEKLLEHRDTLRENLDRLRQEARHDRDHAHQLQLQLQTLQSQRDGLKQTIDRMQLQKERLDERLDVLRESRESAEEPLEDLQLQLEGLLERRLAEEEKLAAARDALEDIDREVRDREQGRNRTDHLVQDVRSRLEKLKMESQALEIRSDNHIEQLTELNVKLHDVLEQMPDGAEEKVWAEELEKVGNRIQRLGAINLAAIEEYQVQSERKNYLDEQHNDLMEALETLDTAIRKIDRETRQRFKETFDQVNGGLQALFPKVFGGGNAYLELTGEDLLETGVTIMARPPGKKNSTIHLLSGGEKALTAIALVFSIFQLNPAPFCMLDEVDAPLDDANVGRYANMVKEMSKQVQFIYITHNKIAMEMADQLMGVTMHEPGCSRLVSVDVDEAAALAEA
ncbi:MAG: chromosome segregation protein SMC [Marinobacter excellens HL-55]|uniref:Chromosome partition protein Smc n=1 Tax=Marinobacter excellens HL-55 TaxID=1305731 RepID=A0A0P8B2A8_9GAMM|nr:MAG: chromosome segregation protein SMC [Marinobacter excellens HL-55]